MTKFLDYVVGQLSFIHAVDIIDICVVAIITFNVIKIVRETRAIQIVKGILALILVYLVSYYFELKTMSFIMRNLLQIGALAVLVVFQPELRRALEHVGRTKISSFNFFGYSMENNESQEKLKKSINEISDACVSLSRQKTGALLVFERETPLEDIVNTGTVLDAVTSYELVGNIFFHNAPLHDGAVVVRNAKLHAAGCYLPLSDNFTISKELGTRHRAALGISEHSDAIVVVVSEETGKITLAENGKLKRGLTGDELRSELNRALVIELENKSQRLSKFFKMKKDD